MSAKKVFEAAKAAGVEKERNVFLVCSMFDLVAAEHFPLFFAKNLATMWRSVDLSLAQAKSLPNHDELVIFIHGEFDIFDHKGGFQPYLEPSIFSLDRAPIPQQSVDLKVAEVANVLG